MYGKSVSTYCSRFKWKKLVSEYVDILVQFLFLKKAYSYCMWLEKKLLAYKVKKHHESWKLSAV